ncbi:MAG: serpin family protein [Anaerolineae bacterium]
MNRLFLSALTMLAVLALVGCQTTGVTPTNPPAANSPTAPATLANSPAATRTAPAAPTTPSQNLPQGALVQSSKARLVVNAPNADLAELAAGNNAFAFDLYQRLSKGDGNLFYSPYSISLALAMTYAGAQGNTAQQMANTLHYTLPQNHLHPAFNSLDRALASRGQGAQGKDGKGFRLKVANALWGQQGYTFLAPFLDVLAENYGAGLRVLDFRAPEPARATINKWVSDQTEGKIPELLGQGTITPDSKLVLTNAIYFNAAWASQFQKEQTQDGPFHLLDGSTVTAPLMQQTEFLSYAKGDGFEALELPYDGNQLSMLIVVPAPGQFQQVQGTLSADKLHAIAGSMKSAHVNLTLPKWKFDTTLMLADTLRDMGMTDAVTPGKADFSGMDGTHDLLIGQVIHKAYVAVDETGTEAAAATAIIMVTSAMPGQPVTVTIDRPFFFFIRDIETGTILFAGRVVNPK